MFNTPMNALAVIVAAVSNMVVGWLWYGPLFGKKWMALTGVTPGDGNSPGKAMGVAFISSLFTAYFLARVIGGMDAGGVAGAIGIAFWVWFGFILMSDVMKVAFEDRSITLVAINTGAQLVWFIVAAIIIGIWP